MAKNKKRNYEDSHFEEYLETQKIVNIDIEQRMKDAFIDYAMSVIVSRAGAVKRSEVIDTIFQKYPILNRVTDQDALIAEIDNMIDSALVEMREILSKNLERLA